MIEIKPEHKHKVILFVLIIIHKTIIPAIQVCYSTQTLKQWLRSSQRIEDMTDVVNKTSFSSLHKVNNVTPNQQ
jgi:hypothetical protein